MLNNFPADIAEEKQVLHILSPEQWILKSAPFCFVYGRYTKQKRFRLWRNLSIFI